MRLGGVLGRLGGVLGRLGDILGRLGHVLEASWAVLKASYAVLADGICGGRVGSADARGAVEGQYWPSIDILS